jgi:hypothetical protein
MGNVFHGWRRKVGCITLLMALILTAGWLRSFSLEECLCQVFVQQNIELVSAAGSLGWRKVTLLYPNTFTTMYRPPQGYSARRHSRGRTPPIPVFPIVSTEHKWTRESTFEIPGFTFVTARADWNDIRMSVWIVPYWSLVIPLTLVSAWLLVSKPRRRTKKS